MSAKASTLKSSIENFIRRQGIDAEMEQNLVKEAIHLHLLSAMSDAGILRHAVFQGGTALRLCYAGERYSEDLDFVCGKSGSYFTDVEFKDLIETALETTKKTLSRDFGIDSNQISLKKPEHPDLFRAARAVRAAALSARISSGVSTVRITSSTCTSCSQVELSGSSQRRSSSIYRKMAHAGR